MIENKPIGYGQAALVEVVAMMLLNEVSPTPWMQLRPEQRNSTRRQANTLINEALEFWDREKRREEE